MANEKHSGTPSIAPSGENDLLTEIQRLVLDGVNETLRRACEPPHSTTDPRILDQKGGSDESEGVLQDCEFGLMLVTAEEWLSKRGAVHGLLAESGVLQQVVVSLVRRSLDRVAANLAVFKGGALKDSPVFFSGEPYTYYEPRPRVVWWSANLDAAMLIVAFLSAALEKFDEALADPDLPVAPKLKEAGISSVRDAALFVCKEGLRYAVACRVEIDGAFQGFTSDPEGKAKTELDNFDRLFFTWTACETIRELLNWKDFLASQPQSPLVQETRHLLESLEADLKAASLWARRTFLDTFVSLSVPNPPPAKVVSDFQVLGIDGKPSAELEKQVGQVAGYVRHIYHVSQYAAVRSIYPAEMDAAEVRNVSNLLDTIVMEHILGSGLDVARHQDLYDTLSRYYALAWSGNQKSYYKDDAYYPLVVRSLAGLLTRTITTLVSEGVKRDVVRELIAEFRRVLRSHFNKLKERRPEKSADGDELLWSYAVGAPYMFYATQRTVFALQTYAEFLEEMAKFESEDGQDVDAAQVERQLRDLLADRLSEILVGPVIKEFIQQTVALRTASASGAPPASPAIESALPNWARPAISEWLHEFEGVCPKLDSDLKQQADNLVLYRQAYQELESRAPTMLTSKETKILRAFREALEVVGPEMDRLHAGNLWNKETLVPLLFGYYLRHYGGEPAAMALSKETAQNDALHMAMGKMYLLVVEGRGT